MEIFPERYVSSENIENFPSIFFESTLSSVVVKAHPIVRFNKNKINKFFKNIFKKL
jgi:hypothetical protein